jgi:8-oxo-dGTP pyrophosphatase MutT (NUDIX family)
MPTVDAVAHALRGREPTLAQGAARRAAVAVVLRPASDGAEVLLMRRAESPRDPWSGHVSFPGGHSDPADVSLRVTAEREALEEVGLELPREARFLGALDELLAIARGRRTGLAISPFVYALSTREPRLVPNEEVAELFWAALAPMLRGEQDTLRPYEHEGRQYDLPAFAVGGKIVWGLTYQMLRGLLGLLGSRGPRR